MAKMSQIFAPRDMTVGKPWKSIVEFSILMLIGNLAHQLYNTVDSIIVGRYIGDRALAAAGSTFPILFMLFVFSTAISMSTSIMVSHYFGTKDREGLSRTIETCITLTAITSAIITLLIDK